MEVCKLRTPSRPRVEVLAWCRVCSNPAYFKCGDEGCHPVFRFLWCIHQWIPYDNIGAVPCKPPALSYSQIPDTQQSTTKRPVWQRHQRKDLGDNGLKINISAPIMPTPQFNEGKVAHSLLSRNPTQGPSTYTVTLDTNNRRHEKNNRNSNFCGDVL